MRNFISHKSTGHYNWKSESYKVSSSQNDIGFFISDLLVQYSQSAVLL